MPSPRKHKAARALGLQLNILNASRESDFDAVFLNLVQMQAGGLVISADALFNDQRDKIIALAKHYSVPTMYEWREGVAAGGLISYGTRRTDAYRQIGLLAGRQDGAILTATLAPISIIWWFLNGLHPSIQDGRCRS
jgi:ABC-type uncharacterized transport system substrate-binding protein